MTRSFGRLCLTFTLVAFLHDGRSCPAADASAFDAVLEGIRSKDLKKHVSVLASDTFEGREAGSRGGRAAGAYLTQHLKKLDVVPAGDEKTFFQEFDDNYRNVLAVVTGSDPNLKSEYILIGAHYDHVGYGNWRNSRGPVGRIHNGADDNASGTSAMLEIIEALATVKPRPKRSVLFAFWDAEEKGLLGSEHWVATPTVPLQKIQLVFNIDMIGRLRKHNVEVYGVRTASGLRSFVSRLNYGSGLQFAFTWELPRNSDHYPFLERRIPFIMYHTRKHADYHRPSDDADKINYEGMQNLSRILFKNVYAAAQLPKRFRFRPSSFYEDESDRKRLAQPLPASPTRLGISWDTKLDEKGIVKLTSVAYGSPAAKAGLKVGDEIIEFNGYQRNWIDDLRSVVLASPRKTSVLIKRDGEEKPLTIEMTLDGTPQRVGINWRVDVAEPDTVILTRVAPGSPAAKSGLRINDRIYSVSGHRFTSSDQFRKLVTTASDQIELVSERGGQIRTATLKFLPAATKQAQTKTPDAVKPVTSE